MANTSASTPTNGVYSGREDRERDLDALSEQISTLREDLAGLTELVGEIGSRRGKDARRTVESKANEMRHQGEDLLREAGRRYAELEDTTKGHIRATPFQAVGIAAAAGFLLGFLNSRR